MAIEDTSLKLGPAGAISPFEKTGAVVRCRVHPEIVVRINDAEKEREAYELADKQLQSLSDDERQAAKISMAESLQTTASHSCPLCDAEKGRAASA
jgi:hypothetical protein